METRDTHTTEDIERWVVTTCRGLGLRVDDAEVDFFSCGGTSLAAMRLIATVEDAFGEGVLPLDAFYDHPVLREIAGLIAENRLATPQAG